MRREYTREQLFNPLTVLRKAGYSPFRDPNTGETSFVIRLTTDFYPRFHLYVEVVGERVALDLHLDQKKPSYGSGRAHAGEYDGPVIEKEMTRIDGWARKIYWESVAK